MLTSVVAQAQSTVPFVPVGFQVPATLGTKEFRLRMLTVNDVVKDYDAVRVAREWPFKKVTFPGRDIAWEAWQAIPERPEVLNSM